MRLCQGWARACNAGCPVGRNPHSTLSIVICYSRVSNEISQYPVVATPPRNLAFWVLVASGDQPKMKKALQRIGFGATSPNPVHVRPNWRIARFGSPDRGSVH